MFCVLCSVFGEAYEACEPGTDMLGDPVSLELLRIFVSLSPCLSLISLGEGIG